MSHLEGMQVGVYRDGRPMMLGGEREARHTGGKSNMVAQVLAATVGDNVTDSADGWATAHRPPWR